MGNTTVASDEIRYQKQYEMLMSMETRTARTAMRRQPTERNVNMKYGESWIGWANWIGELDGRMCELTITL